MVRYKKYLVKPYDQFDPEKFPFLVDDIESIMSRTAKISSVCRTDIIVSFLRDNVIKPELKQENPALTSLVESGTVSTSNLQSLFDSCRENSSYNQELEGFIKKHLSE